MHLTEMGRRAARAIRRGNLRRLLPAAVAAFAAIGMVAGVLTAVLGNHPDSTLAAAGAKPAATASAQGGTPALFNLPTAHPSNGSIPVLPSLASGALLTDANIKGAPKVAPLRRSLQASLLVVAPSTLSHRLLDKVSGLHGVTAAERIEAVRMRLNGSYTAVLGVDPSVFRSFAAHTTGASDQMWEGVASGGVAVSYTMGKLGKLPLGGTLAAAGKTTENLRVVAFGTLGIGGVNAVVSDKVARSLGAPDGNAIVISAQPSAIAAVKASVKKLAPRSASVQQLVTVIRSGGVSTSAGAGSAGGVTVPNSQVNVMLKAAMSRLGMPYVWGAEGPTQFDCSGLVQWSFARAGIAMPRVAADQAMAGPAVSVSDLRAGDLLFYHTDPTDPGYISHVAIYIGNGWMLQAPEPGKNVEVVPAGFGPEFAGAIRVSPAQAAAVASGVA